MLAPYPPATPSVYGTDFTSLYILEKILLVKKHKKCVRYKKSKSLFFDVMENIAKFSLQKLAFFKMITDSHIHILRLLPYMGKTRYPSKSQFFKSHFSTKWQGLLYFLNSTCSYHACNLHQTGLPTLQAIFTFLFHLLPYLSHNIHQHYLPLHFTYFSHPYFYIQPSL